MIERVYHKKHFYKVTWGRSEAMLREVPWLKDVREDFCMIGYREPTAAEAERFIGSRMYDRLFDSVCAVEEISKEEALRDFNMEDWRYQKVFAYEEFHPVRASLMEKLADARVRSEAEGLEQVSDKEMMVHL